MSDDLEPLRQHAQQSNVVKSLVPFYLRYHIKKSWIYTQSYYDDPEGKNLFGKLVAINKIVAGPVAVLAWADILMISKVTDYQRMVGRLSYYAYPFFGAASCFAIGTYAATNIRGKDDSWVFHNNRIQTNIFGQNEIMSLAFLDGITLLVVFLLVALSRCG